MHLKNFRTKHISRIWRLLLLNMRADRNRPAQPIFINSIPKAGTNLAVGLVGSCHKWKIAVKRGFRPWLYSSEDEMVDELRSLKSGFVYHGHLPFNPRFLKALKESGAVVIFVHRPIIDVALSQWKYIRYGDTSHRYWSRLDMGPIDLMKAIILGNKDQPGLPKIFEDYKGWYGEHNVLSVSFAELINWKVKGMMPDNLKGLDLEVQDKSFLDKYSQTFAENMQYSEDELSSMKNLVEELLAE